MVKCVNTRAPRKVKFAGGTETVKDALVCT